MFKNYISIALRILFRNKAYAFINIIGLSFGLACVMLIVLYVKDELSYDRFHPNLQNIYRVASKGTRGAETRKDGNTGYFQGPRFAANVAGIETFVRIQSGRQEIKTGSEVITQELLYVDSNFFSAFNFPLLQGNPKTCLLQPYSVVLSEAAAQKYLGTKQAIGRSVLIKQNEVFVPYNVTAIARQSPQNSSIKFEMLLPLQIPPEQMANAENWFNFFLNTFVVLTPKASIQQVEKGINTFYVQDSKEALKIVTEKYGPAEVQSEYFLQPFAAMHLDAEVPPQNGLSDASNPIYSYILSGIALFILIIACINFINLSIGRSARRAKEIGIRKVVGGDRKQLMFQFLGETFLLSLFAFIFALLIIYFTLPVFNTLANKTLSFANLLDAKLVAAYSLLFLITSFLAGFYPALFLSAYNPVDTLYSRFALTGKNYLQKSLVVLQFSLASFLIIGTFAVYSQFTFLTQTKLGYDDTNVVVVGKQPMNRAEATRFKNELLKSPSISDVTAKNSGNWITAAKVNGDSAIDFAYQIVDEDFLPLLKIPVLKGRNFSHEYSSDLGNAVMVNQSFVKRAGWTNPIGQVVDFWYNNAKYRVIGVVPDYHFNPLNQLITPQLFVMKSDNEYGEALIKIKTDPSKAALSHIEKTFRRLFPNSPYSYQFKDEENRKQYEAEAKWKQIVLSGALLTIFISCIGLFGLSVLAAEKRTKEIGIRKVLGASVQNILLTLSKDFVALVLVAFFIAMPIAWMATDKWLQNYPYRIPLGWPMFVASAALVTFVALATIGFHSFRTANANPVKSLRME